MTSFERVGQFLDGLQQNTPDTFAVNCGVNCWDFENVKAWSVAGQLRHYWAPLWRSNLMASYRRADLPAVAMSPAYGFGDADGWDVGANLIWGQARKTAEIGVEVVYKAVQQDVRHGVNPDGSNSPGRSARLNGIETDPAGWVVSAFISRNW
jgi:hypothetical protein